MKVSNMESLITSRDVAACHRISIRSTDVIVRMVNRKDVVKTLENRMQINNYSKGDLGLPPNRENISRCAPYFSKLAFYCRKLKKNKFVNEISTKRGKLRIQLRTQSEDSAAPALKWYNIDHINDLHVLFGEDLGSKVK